MVEQLDAPRPIAPGVNTRMRALLETILDESTAIPKPLRPVINNLLAGYMDRGDEAETAKLIANIRDEVIPFILYGPPNEDKN